MRGAAKTRALDGACFQQAYLLQFLIIKSISTFKTLFFESLFCLLKLEAIEPAAVHEKSDRDWISPCLCVPIISTCSEFSGFFSRLFFHYLDSWQITKQGKLSQLFKLSKVSPRLA